MTFWRRRKDFNFWKGDFGKRGASIPLFHGTKIGRRGVQERGGGILLEALMPPWHSLWGPAIGAHCFVTITALFPLSINATVVDNHYNCHCPMPTVGLRPQTVQIFANNCAPSLGQWHIVILSFPNFQSQLSWDWLDQFKIWLQFQNLHAILVPYPLSRLLFQHIDFFPRF